MTECSASEHIVFIADLAHYQMSSNNNNNILMYLHIYFLKYSLKFPEHIVLLVDCFIARNAVLLLKVILFIFW